MSAWQDCKGDDRLCRLNVSALNLGAALGSVVGGEVLRLGSPVDLGWGAAVYPVAGLLIVLGLRREPQPSVAAAE